MSSQTDFQPIKGLISAFMLCGTKSFFSTFSKISKYVQSIYAIVKYEYRFDRRVGDVCVRCLTVVLDRLKGSINAEGNKPVLILVTV